MAVSETRVTRGRLLKRAGVGAAALGAGSMLTASTAGASAPASTSCINLGGCSQNIVLSACGPVCNACGCGITTEGCCFCWENVFCAGLPTCTASSQCPPGWNCVVVAASGCGGGSFCLPHCGACNHHTPCSCATSPAASKAGGATIA
jgi:hypothetical protein